MIPKEAVIGEDGLNLNDSRFLETIIAQAKKLIADELVS